MGKKCVTKNLNVNLPEQLDKMIEAAAMFGSGKFPNVHGVVSDNTNKKDVIGSMLFKDCYTFLKENNFLDAVVRGWEMHTSEKFDHNLYGLQAPAEAEEKSDTALAGLGAKPEV